MRRQAYCRETELVTRAVAQPPFGPGFRADALADADALELWVSESTDLEDLVEWRLCRGSLVLAVVRLPGY
jgi:hypothetical protein